MLRSCSAVAGAGVDGLENLDGEDDTSDSRSESASPDEESKGRNDAGGNVELGRSLREMEIIS